MERDVRESSEVGRYIQAALVLLRDQGAAQLTVRRVAEAAGTSTMGIYTTFGGRAGLLEAVYRHGFELLRDVLVTAKETAEGEDTEARIRGLAVAYLRFARQNPSLYALMFERPLPGFDPPPGLRAEVMAITFALVIEEIAALKSGDPLRHAYLLWTTIHGLVSIELTHNLRSPLPDWFINSPEAGEKIVLDGVTALLAGLRALGA
ncbi:TetR/AcrR family transcriptional regulator [Streptosporangiaceae bacterium NEAU-GS5]|nr:TetR/AcrR family transcriptional regulator [Streptosporangiaceae bacterium NEAU-GS5]